MKEIWKKIPSCPNYEASNYGRIRSFVVCAEGRILRPQACGAGYLAVKANGKQVKVHRLVYEAWNGEIPAGLTVNHMNCNKHDNEPGNLEVCTHKENMRHYYAWKDRYEPVRRTED